jgi:2-enoate reductase
MIRVIIESKSSGKKELHSDMVVLAVGMEARNSLYKILAGKIPYIHALEDCREPRNITGAIWESMR